MTGGRVAILGPTGRNVAAGMSGGTAYVMDLDEAKVNREMVDLEPLDDGDRETLRQMLAEHAIETGSPLARALVDSAEISPFWSDRFTKVMPRDYKKVLLAMERARETGEDMDTAIMAATAAPVAAEQKKADTAVPNSVALRPSSSFIFGAAIAIAPRST